MIDTIDAIYQEHRKLSDQVDKVYRVNRRKEYGNISKTTQLNTITNKRNDQLNEAYSELNTLRKEMNLKPLTNPYNRKGEITK